MAKQTVPLNSQRELPIDADSWINIGTDSWISTTARELLRSQSQIDENLDRNFIIESLKPLEINTESVPHPLVNNVKIIVDIVQDSETQLLDSLTEGDYQRLVKILDGLIDIVKEDETHILSPIMDFIGILVENYEDRNVPELSQI